MYAVIVVGCWPSAMRFCRNSGVLEPPSEELSPLEVVLSANWKGTTSVALWP